MISRILFMFAIFAGLAYYFDIDVRDLVDRSGAPKWLAEHGIPLERGAASIGTSTLE